MISKYSNETYEIIKVDKNNVTIIIMEKIK